MKTLKKLRAKMRKWMEGGPRRPPVRQARPHVEALDGRLLPSVTVPSLVGRTLNFIDRQCSYGLCYAVSNGRSLQVLTEQDNGNGTGTFTGWYQGNYGCALVTGSIFFKSYDAVSPQQFPTYDFGISYSGVGTSYFGGVDFVQGGGDVWARSSTASFLATTNALGSSYYYTNSYIFPLSYYAGWSSEMYQINFSNQFGYAYPTDQPQW